MSLSSIVRVARPENRRELQPELVLLTADESDFVGYAVTGNLVG